MAELRKEINSDDFGDARVMGFGWDNDGKDIWIQFQLANTKIVKLCFVWTTELLINMDFGDYFGMPLAFGAKFNRIEGDGWNVEIAFGVCPDGLISFRCNDILTSELD